MNVKYWCRIAILAAGMQICGCAWIDDVGKGKSYATLESLSEASELTDSQQCAYDKLPLKFKDFDADEPQESMGRLRFYESLATPIRSNYMEIRFLGVDAETKAKCPAMDSYVGTTFEVTAHGCVQAAIQFDGCEPPVTLQFVGEMTLDEYSTERRTRVSGTLSGDLMFLEQVKSSIETVEISTKISEASMEFSFVNHVGAAWD